MISNSSLMRLSEIVEGCIIGYSFVENGFQENMRKSARMMATYHGEKT
jgi:hypothetical protein